MGTGGGVVLVIPTPVGKHRRFILQRWESLRTLVHDAQRVPIEMVVVLEARARVSLALALGADAVAEVAMHDPRACPLLGRRPWVALLVVVGEEGRVFFVEPTMGN